MTAQLVKKSEYSTPEFAIIEQVVMQGDLSALSPEQRVFYYNKVCESAGLNPYTRPFDYIKLNGKLTLYAKKDCTEQLRRLNGISIEGMEDKVIEDLYIVKAKAKTKDGRTDESTGAVCISNLKGEQKANAIMKAETKAKRRVTLSISGLGWVDESEIESIPNANKVTVDENGNISPEITVVPINVDKQNKPTITPEQAKDLEMILEECESKYKIWVYDYLKRQFSVDNLYNLPAELYEKMKAAAIKNMDQNHEKQRKQSPQATNVEVVQ